MITSILLLAVIFIAGLFTTNLPSKLFALLMISVKNSNSSPPDAEFVTKSKNTAVAGGGVEKKINSCSNKDELKQIFATFDKDGDGNITKQELKQSLKNMGMVLNEKEIEELIWTVDSNEDGLIDLDEFCESFAPLLSTNRIEEEDDEEGGNNGEREMNLKEAFDVFDEDKDGVITVEELGLVLSSMGFTQGKRLEECSKMIKKVDIDGDGMVNFDEFKKMMKHGDGFVAVA